MASLRSPNLTVEEYLAADRVAELPSEYHDGEMFQIEAATVVHGRLVVNIGRRLAEQLESSRCAIAAQVRVRINATKYAFPDLIVYCGKPATTDAHQDTITNPKVIVEILSPTTEGYDRGAKFDLYRELPSLEEYVLVSQDKQRIETLQRTPEGDWLLKRFEGSETLVAIHALDISFPLGGVYAGVF
ncbi:MAG: Uma2 family endonuclease [Bryobacteraceae bacterium]